MNDTAQTVTAEWTEGTHADLLADVRRRGLNQRIPQRWIWDPRPDRSNAGRHAKKRVGYGVECPFLTEDVRLLEAHAYWDEVVPTESRSLLRTLGQWFRRQPKAAAKVPGVWRLLVLGTRSGLRWSWTLTPASSSQPGQGDKRS